MALHPAPALEIGMTLRTFDDIGAAARRYEELGYDYLACGEHVSFHSPMPNSLISLSVAAGATSTIRLLSAITLVPLYPPVLLAKMVAALDVASRGRLTLGVGVGGEHPPEFEACGVPVAERGARTNEALDVLTRLCSGGSVSYQGKFTRFSDIAIKPPPAQQPHPPIWVSGRSPAAMRRAARFGAAWMPYMFTPDMVAESAARVEELAGRPLRSALLIFFCVHRDGETARAMAAEGLTRQYGQDFSRLVDRYALAGTPDEVVGQVRRFTDAGVSALMVASACPAAYLNENLALFAAEVLPALREF
jgi:probable F420-dependent oxidoreductase